LSLLSSKPFPIKMGLIMDQGSMMNLTLLLSTWHQPSHN